ncbi:DgyrCDS8072 [Dimorphilus gyrociliatus]|uniref:DgyrCDS8072 n=1 Tax=Dimorphilus gyrociliatus TaxID=2664684 RepID=A0A7I8VY33_9ANNE|nr:DgyrCDS8072 [Dimorphilus gyrociliatus]
MSIVPASFNSTLPCLSFLNRIPAMNLYYLPKSQAERKAKPKSTVTILWFFLSIAVSAIALFSFLQPYWYIEGRTQNAIGIYTFCVRAIQDQFLCGKFGKDVKLNGILRTVHWTFGAGSVLMLFTACLTLINLFLRSEGWVSKKFVNISVVFQIIAVILLLIGLALVPAGLESKFFHHFCSKTKQCHMGWTYMMAVTGTALAIFCPILAKYTNAPSFVTESIDD